MDLINLEKSEGIIRYLPNLEKIENNFTYVAFISPLNKHK